MVNESPFLANFSTTGSYACYCFSASYSVTASYCPDYLKPKPYVPPADAGVKDFFISMGYNVGQDGKRWGAQWWEVWRNDELVCQVDRGVPLQEIIDDMTQWHLGKDGISKSDWTCSGPETPALKDLFRKVHDFKMYGTVPTDHLVYEI